MEEWIHIPVLKREVLEILSFGDAPARLIDGTLGNGGHSAALLRANPGLEILGIDRDEEALARAGKNLAFAGARFRSVRGNYSDLRRIAEEAGWENVDGILLDIGISSPQIDDPARGFSWRMDGPLDMRMDRRSPRTASRLLNQLPEEELKTIFREYGEIRKAGRLAQVIVAEREKKPFATTGDLVAAAEKALGRSRPGELPTPTLVFQALRIAVNDELGELNRALRDAVEILKPGGRLAVISFHSLEDRIVKNFMRDASRECVCPPGLPVCVCNHHAAFTLPVRGVVTASEIELQENRRAACAKLRIADRTEF